MSALTVIVKTTAPGYVCPVTRLRVRIGKYMYTADIDQVDLTDLEGDENVASYARSEHVPLVKQV